MVAALLLCRRGRELGLFALAAAVTGGLQVAAHPLVQEADRLGVLMWMPAVLGLPLLIVKVRRNGDSGEDDSSERPNVVTIEATKPVRDGSGAIVALDTAG
jgi:hypothetical protein